MWRKMFLYVNVRDLLRETFYICIVISLSILLPCFNSVLHICSFKDGEKTETLGGICEK